ncbi:glycoside hydrolase family 27 protein [Tsukamurella sputi]|uniref:Alpha-galactosidase n=1 Tax=Tsukamurella sputi TaxID=2591848 RepID=A0A5C5RQ14_9ACTN|nr:glycoside hydrolase family 27 protein [Tsukamurella sputi]TWS24752.1 glycoside hydrolase family 27 protein [Tsukamurella sputi]
MRNALLPVVAMLLVSASACGSPVDPPRAPVAPTLGWDSWNVYGCGVTEDDVERQANGLVTSGLAAAGYRTVVVDDCWSAPDRGADGRLRANPSTFPSGMAALGAYLHARGLRFGLYASPGDRTCAQRSGAYPGRTGSAGTEDLDARTFAAWGVDYLKYDWCGSGTSRSAQVGAFRVMRDALARTGRTITYAINPNSGVAGTVPGATGNWAGIADAVRVTNDVVPTWRTGAGPEGDQGIGDVLADVPPAPGTVRDLDMLVVGLPGVSDAQARTQILEWSRLGSPLILGCDVSALTPEVRALLTDAARR